MPKHLYKQMWSEHYERDGTVLQPIFLFLTQIFWLVSFVLFQLHLTISNISVFCTLSLVHFKGVQGMFMLEMDGLGNRQKTTSASASLAVMGAKY